MSEGSNFGELIGHYRTLRDLSLRQVEEQVGMSATNLSRIERGIVGPPPFDVIVKLAEVLDAPVDQLSRAAGIRLGESSGSIDLDEAIVSAPDLDEDEKSFMLQALRLVKSRPGSRRK